MKLQLQGRLLSGFLSVALLLLLTGAIGIFLIDRVSTTTNVVLDDKKPLEENAMRLLMSVERSISLARGYVLNLDSSQAEVLLEEIEEESVNVETLVEFMGYSDSIKENLEQVTTLYQQFYQVTEEVVELHDGLIDYNFLLNVSV